MLRTLTYIQTVASKCLNYSNGSLEENGDFKQGLLLTCLTKNESM